MKLKDITINMMVKNEERYIEQTLRSVLPYVELANIVDTGSTDNTYDILERTCEEFAGQVGIRLSQENIDGDSINWNGNHLSAELTAIRNQMLKDTPTKYAWQVDGDEIYLPETIKDIQAALWVIEYNPLLIGSMVPIKWCISNEEYVEPGPYPKTLRIMPSRGRWIGEFPNEFLWVDNKPIHINDERCNTLSSPFLHMSMALHPERRPVNGQILSLTEEEKELLNVSSSSK